MENGYAITMGLLLGGFAIFAYSIRSDIKDMFKHISNAKER